MSKKQKAAIIAAILSVMSAFGLTLNDNTDVLERLDEMEAKCFPTPVETDKPDIGPPSY